jgi:hypothetical protein
MMGNLLQGIWRDVLGRLRKSETWTHAFTPLILRKSRMRRRARTDICGGRSEMVVPTATSICQFDRQASVEF